MKEIKKISVWKTLLIGIAILLPFAMSLSTIISGNIDFGYDTARDFLSGLNNLHKLTLIGPTSGIPGIFYGPYWIWLISAGLAFSRDPRVVVFLILTIPYFVIFPLILFKFRKIFGTLTCVILWLLFIFSTGLKYSNSPWNPHPAPLLFLILVYLITFTNLSEKGYSKYLKTFLIGIISGLILNFHISFGLGVGFGTLIFFVVDFIKQSIKVKNKWKNLFLEQIIKVIFFGVGIIFTFFPFFIFESRHAFLQTKTAIKVLTAKGSVVAVVGLGKDLILQSFFGTIGVLTKLPIFLAIVLFIFSAIYFVHQLKQKKIKLEEEEVKLLQLLLSVIFGILFLYLTSKNPVWSYHFIGVEVIFLLLVGLIVSKVKLLKLGLFAWILLALVLNSSGIINSFHQNPYVNSSSLANEEQIAKTIIIDAGKTNYNVFPYSPSIYSYEYSYLFNWFGNRDFPYDPGQNHLDTNIVYLIIPPSKKTVEQNFINYHTPSKRYLTIQEWRFQDGTAILERAVKK